ncbi:MAG: hypothetical protein A2Z16_00800 [Chloroflexi bacterium RBG_16_54_18]|nr:MAG: hypothetical protein A2Z16_00800 [Chloroflexi bacterium RBG_16_54_18]
MDLNPSTSLRAGVGLTQALSDGTNTYLYGLERIAQVNAGLTPTPSASWAPRKKRTGKASPKSLLIQISKYAWLKS